MKQFHDAKVFSLTPETRIKDAVNMEDLICLLATFRTLNDNDGYLTTMLLKRKKKPFFPQKTIGSNNYFTLVNHHFRFLR